ncbi:Stk1 family PASTA domain-containing Ser/Thr kinase [Mariniluteicoccus flavus]
MTTTSTRDPLVGTVLDGRYEVVRKLARGGMATVYEATDTRLTRQVAVKVMHQGLGDDQDFAAKFDREARAAAKLSHPNVVSVFDQGHDLDRPYIVMEFVSGCTMRNVISRDAPLTPVACLEMIDHVLSALAAAHDSGLVHRDVKPENILISDRGQLKVADFGLARAITAQTATATQGMLIGTVSYLPPELVTTGRADARSDVYSAGVVLFEMLTGSKPHTGETPIQVAYAHVHNEIPAPSTRLTTSWRTSRDGVPPYVDALVRAATQRDPLRRPANARAMQQMVRKALTALDAGIMNDPALTIEFSRGFADLEQTEPMDWHTPLSPSVSSDPAHDALHVSRRIAASPQNQSVQGSARSARSGVSGMSGVSASSMTRVRRLHSGSAQSATPMSPSMMDAYETFPSGERETVSAIPVPARPARPKKPKRHGSSATGVRRPHRGRIAVVVLATLLVLGSLAGAGWWFTAGQYVAAPDVVGRPRAVAAQVATDQKMGVAWVESFSETVPAGSVISSDPAPGTDIPRNGSMTVVVSKGPERFDMPKVVGLKVDDARRVLDENKLAVGSQTEDYDDAAAPGVVLRSSVEPGTKLKRDDRVDLVVSKGPRPIDVPTFTGKSADEAKAALEKLGLKVDVKTENHKQVPVGRVISQTPDKGQAKKGDTITLVRSLGPVMVAVPQTRAMGVAEATDALKKAGFQVATKQSGTYLGLGYVAYSEVAAGSKAPEGSTITLFLV